MIISRRHEFVFVHIPKCAGTSVRVQIAESDPDHIALAGVGSHPVLGRIDFGHVPLDQLRLHFPDHYADLEALPAFAVIRDPLSRFGSAFRQHLWQYEGKPMTLVDPEVLRRRAIETIDRLGAEIDAPPREMIFFARQTAFVYDGERRLVDHLVPIERLGAFISFLSRRTGTAMDSGRRSNQNVSLRAKWLGPAAYRVNDILRRHLPSGLHARIKDAAVGVLAAPGNAAEDSGILEMPQVRDFVESAYAGDARLYTTAQAESPALLAGFESGRLPSPGPDAG